MMTIRIPNTGTDMQLPPEMRARLAANLKDTNTPEGAAVAEVAGSNVTVEVDPDGVPVLVIGG